jgi:hypothetical protein
MKPSKIRIRRTLWTVLLLVGLVVAAAWLLADDSTDAAIQYVLS